MRFMMIIKGNADYEAGVPPSPALMAGMGRLSEEMMKAGVVVANGGLLPSAHGARIALERGKRTVIDGPFAEAKEVIGGFAIIEARGRQEAIALAHRVIDVHVDAGIKDMQMEIRPMFDAGECAGSQAATAPACA
jgi:hypothetical protein